MGRGDGKGRSQLRLSQPEVAAEPQNLGKEDGSPTPVEAKHDAATARAAWLETIRVMARCMARQDHAQMMREDSASRG